MTALGDLITRMGLALQDSDHVAWSEAEKRRAVLDAIAQVSRQEVCGEVEWRQGQAAVAQYTLRDATVSIMEVVYDGRSLRRVDDVSLAHHARQWEQRQGTPQYYSTLLEPPVTVRVMPTPIATGSAVPQVPGLPLMQQEEDNLLAWTFVNPQGDEETLALPEVLDDVVVFGAVAALCEQVSEYQDVPKAMAYRALAQWIMTMVLGGKEQRA